MSRSSITINEDVLGKLIEIGIALSATRRLEDLLDKITTEARKLTYSDAASLYLVEDGGLRFAVSQNESLKLGANEAASRAFASRIIAISAESIVGYAVLTKEVELVEDAYAIASDKPYHHNKAFDQANNYRTQSIMTVPMLDVDNAVIGVLQLINHLSVDNEVIPYPEAAVPLVKALASQAAVAVKSAQLSKELKAVQYDTIIRLSTAAEFRDNETAKHVQRVGLYCKTIAEQLGLPGDEQEAIHISSPMHDIGKIGIPDAILLKPGRFTPEERKVMETHTQIGARIMEGSRSQLIETCKSIALSHHEKFDGTGYPFGLKGEAIPLVGRIVAVADVFDAVCSKRVYKEAVPFEDVLPIIRTGAGQHFDPACVEAFFKGLPAIRTIFHDLQD
ncbi:MAG: HD domain-containing protein [Myxococcales bacterium]|nr:MAG: HD domain-containing protein [Myxococcales bacterium]